MLAKDIFLSIRYDWSTETLAAFISTFNFLVILREIIGKRLVLRGITVWNVRSDSKRVERP